MADLRTIPEVSQPKYAGAPSAANGTAPHVLVVDDNRDAAHTLVRLLSALGISAEEAHSGEAALAAIEKQLPELAFLDLGMPEMDGVETARQIRAHPQGLTIKLVALTGMGQEHDRQRTRAAGFVAHLIKPVELALLEQTLDRFLSHSAGRSTGKSRGGGPAKRLP